MNKLKLCMISITRNDDCRLEEWYNHYLEYKSILDLHIIVDNNSDEKYLRNLKNTFKDSYFIELDHNGGCTESYNKGIEYAISQNMDVISLMANDIEIKSDQISSLLTIMSQENIDMIYPIVLNPNDDIDRIDCYGYNIDYTRLQMKKFDLHLKYNDLPQYVICETGPGGCSFASSHYYKSIGLQDENLFMYKDEVDNGIRAANKQMKVATAKVIAWHRHINLPGARKRNPMAAYLLSRNHIYLANKHLGFVGRLRIYLIATFFALEHYFHISNLRDKENLVYINAYTKGLFAGLKGQMNNVF